MDKGASNRIDEFSARLMIELHDRYQKCEDFAATPSSILLAVVNGIANVRDELGYGNPENPESVWKRIRAEDLP